MNDEQLETELRSAVRSHAESVHPADRLGAIRARTQGGSESARTSWWNRPWLLAAGAGLLAASVVTAAVVLVDTSSDEPPVAGAEREVTVYEIGDAGKGIWLYPVQVTTDDTGDPAVDAVRALLAHEPTGNHFTLWADLCTHTTGFVRADAEVGDANCDLDPQGYEAQQQLAWTVKDASESTGAEEVVLDGAVLRPVAADPAALSPIIIESPTDGATVSSPVTVSGTSDTFEANVVWEVVSDDAGVAKGGHTMGGTMGERAPFEFTVDLPPGNYTARAYAENMETGGLWAEDTVTFTVE